MNALFKNAQDAIDACNAGAEAAWAEYIRLTPTLAPDDTETFAIAKFIFMAGYYEGAKWVSSTMTRKIMEESVPQSTTEATEKMADAEVESLQKNFPPTP